MSGENELVKFLADHPWTSQPVLELVFGPRFTKLARAKDTRMVEVPGVGACWGTRQEKLSSVPGVRRREQARRFLMGRYGKDALWTGGSPGLGGSDLCALVGRDRKFWIRIWIDTGSAAVEALPFLRQDAGGDSALFADLVVTGSLARAELIKKQLSARWKGGNGTPLLYARDEDEYLRTNAYHGSSPSRPTGGIGDTRQILDKLQKQREERLKISRHEQNLGKLFLSLGKADFDLLAYVGDNPAFTAGDLAYLLSHGTTGAFDRGAGPAEKYGAVRARLETLGELGLVENAPAPLAGLIPSALGLEALAAYWGVTQESMRRFHAWPQVRGSAGKIVYSINALAHIQAHTRETQRFIFGLFDCAWRLQKPYGGLDVSLDTVIGKRIYFEDLAAGKLDWVIPDAVIDLSFWRRTWRDGQVHEPRLVFSTARLLVEVDRATNPLTRLGERIQKYGRIWKQLSGDPVQAWIIDGSPWREKEILEMLRAAGIPGWSVRAERLRLEKADPWWGHHIPAGGAVLPYSKHGGAAPLRTIWHSTKDYQLHPLLGQSPWKGEMSHSGPAIRVPRGY